MFLDGVAQMNLGREKDHDVDAFGDACEYLMTMYVYASNAGKSGGDFLHRLMCQNCLPDLELWAKRKTTRRMK